ncbi:DMT family transporter [Pelagibius sp. Alg239-R121]|uniref:DMT family transporter n=1 Tax=Pelagibius sp. Alg239-R121 TaxID=2993448 RepID=UPI0024A753DD|nr:DMT family transporter [Pelagibius sp. Alg239-R121]
MKLDRSLLPGFAVATSAVLWGLWWIPLRWLDDHGLRGDWASFMIFGLASLTLGPFVWRRRGLSDQILPLLAIGVPLGVTMVLWNHAVINGNVIRVVLLFYLSPVWASFMGRFMLGAPIPLTRWIAIALGLAGAAVILQLDLLASDTVSAAYSLADVMALLSGVCFALAATTTRMHGSVRELDKTFVSVFVAAGAALLFVVLTDTPPPSKDVGSLVAVALAVALIFLLPTTALLLWGAALLDPGRVAILLLLEVVAAALSSSLLASEPLGLRELLGCALILCAGLMEAVPAFRPTQA